jgi:cytochrome b subunit of formate dehydrogenase
MGRWETRWNTAPARAVLRRAVLGLGLVLLGGLATTAWAQDTKADAKPRTKAACLECHDDPKVKDAAGKSMRVIGDEFQRSAHRKLDCAECHTSALTVKHTPDKLGPVSPAVCQDCHEDAFKAVAASIHGRRADGPKAIKDCMGCHDSLHTVRKEGDPASTLSPINQIKTCGSCHEDMMADYESSVHARALLKSGLTEAAPSCASCHGKHDIREKADAGATTHPSRIGATCGSCHKTILTEFNESAHGQALAAGKKGPVCSTCHEPHAIKNPEAAAVRHKMSDGCGDCHEKVTASFKDGFHGKATTLGHRKAANASFLSYDPHANPADPSRNAYVHWIYIGMTGLLLGVFGFFGLHGLLWLQRALVGKLRGEFKFGHHSDGPHVRRFSSMQMGVHIVIVVSFLLLAASGLPLKFAGAEWAPTLMSLLGGPEVAGYLHRLAGAVTFGYFIWHLGMLVHGLFFRNERGYFWGPRSMVPQPKDLFDFIGMMKYFLYLGPRPKFDRFTYWEKFDYLAVFWGVAIIGVSGLVLWFPTAATTVLPGWALNAAYVIHSDEALLATGFIFLFHFFHTHLRPEAFPLDPVIFVGCMPLERFKDERPLEYERLVATGKLDELLVPPPTAQAMRRAHVFGFTAVAIGILLAVFIFAGLLGSLH